MEVILSNALNRYYFPSIWKCGKVLPIFKKGKNPSEPVSYRPISLTPSISKVYEVLINRQIVTICEQKKVIPDNQFGFRFQHSTTHAIHKLISDIIHHLRYNEHTAALLIDLEKAFDSGWTNGLLYRCINLVFPQCLILVILDSITSKTFVTWDGSHTSALEFTIEEGFQQGTVNSPILFVILTTHIINASYINKSSEMTPYALRAIAFADDAILYMSGPSAPILQKKKN